MRFLFLGDMVGRAGRNAVFSALPGLVADYRLDFVVVNGENAAALRADAGQKIKAVLAVHVDTSSSLRNDIAALRQVLDDVGHPALLMVDTISGLASIDFRFDEWGVDVAVSGSQKGLMLPPGIAFNAVSARAMAVSETGGMPRSYWDWRDMKASNATGYFPYTPATNMLFGLNEAISMLRDEGLENVFARHQRHGAATRAAVRDSIIFVIITNYMISQMLYEI